MQMTKRLGKLFQVNTLLVLALSAGCGKKAAQAPAPETPAATAEAVPAAPAGTPAPVQPAPGNASLADAQAAMKAGDFNRAATVLTTLQSPAARLTPEQAAAVQKQMQALQASLVGAAASGDPNAKAAIQRLRQASMH